LYPQSDCIKDDYVGNKDEIKQSNQYSWDYWKSNGAKKLSGHSSSYIPTEEEDDIDDENIESFILPFILQRSDRLSRLYTKRFSK
jgi:hypothetical protein